MTKQELKQKFENGERLSQFFGIKKSTYSLGDNRITERQFKQLVNEYKGMCILDISHSGFTRHNYYFSRAVGQLETNIK